MKRPKVLECLLERLETLGPVALEPEMREEESLMTREVEASCTSCVLNDEKKASYHEQKNAMEATDAQRSLR